MLPDLSRRGIGLTEIAPLIDGAVPEVSRHEQQDGHWTWHLAQGGRLTLTLTACADLAKLRVALHDTDAAPLSVGLRFSSVTGVGSYLRNGYQSWDGSFFVKPGCLAGEGPATKSPAIGFAMTALLPSAADGAVVLGFDRHDRFQTRLRFGGTAEAMTIDTETLLDCTGATTGETLLLFEGDEVEQSLRRWSKLIADASPLPPRVPERRITGWCSWYSLYAAIDEATILEHLDAARTFRDTRQVALDVFQIDDGFTPEMGDWLEVKPQFPRGMAPLVADIAAAGFRPGLWIAPFMVGNRSRLFAHHPEWVVQDRCTGGPLVQMRFYGEFRWHKRSEEYYILDITHPDAEAYIRMVFRTWAREWGARYFKTDFMLFGAEHGPDRARWQRKDLSRMAIWRQMAGLIRDEIGEDALWLGCGCPLWASIGYVDAIRIGRDIGVEWHGEYSAESLLRDQLSRNHASQILWQADPDCILLRNQFHRLTDDEVTGLARFAGLTGGVLMTSDKLDALTADRADLFELLLNMPVTGCDFPKLGHESGLVRQIAHLAGGRSITHLFNVGDAPVIAEGVAIPPHASQLTDCAPSVA
jgi:alpha-galactosidase